ncbi:MAG: DNA polymerase III subunit delta [Geminicoccaceae bacterium]
MKLKAGAVDGFLARPDPKIATVLLYGPDLGLIAEHARSLAAKVVDDLRDPFRVSELTGEELRFGRGRLVEEAQALCLMGGRRLVRVREATDGSSDAVRDLLALPAQAGFVVIEAGDLPASSSLRKLIEAAPSAMALPCFHDEDRQLGGLVRSLLQEHGLRAEPDALAFLDGHLGSDRGITRAEIAKLALYMADRPGASMTLADVSAVVGDSSALEVEDALSACLLGRRRELDRALERLLAEGEAPVRLIRAAATMLMRLLRIAAVARAGGSVEAALAAARPPVHFRLQKPFAAALRRWSPDTFAQGLALLQAAELRCKSAGSPDALLCRSALAQLAQLPARRELPADGVEKRR